MNPDIFNIIMDRAEKQDEEVRAACKDVLVAMQNMSTEDRAEEGPEDQREQIMALVHRQAAFGVRVVLAWKALDQGAGHYSLN